MADVDKRTDGPQPAEPDAFDFTQLPDWDVEFIDEEDVLAFAHALSAPETSPSQDDLSIASSRQSSSLFITALNDWRPVRQRVRRKKKKKRQPRRGKDETREGFVYGMLKWPLLLGIFGWLVFLGVSYLLTRLYIFMYEHWITWRGKRQQLRRALRTQTNYEDWVKAAEELDVFLGNDKWKTVDEYSYYDSKTIRRVLSQMTKYRKLAEAQENKHSSDNTAIEDLSGLLEASVKNNFVGFENPRLYSETYYGTKDLVQSFVDEVEKSLALVSKSTKLGDESKRTLFKHLHTNFGRTALCLSGGATFAYYHFGVAKALLDANLLPEVITGTSGGALVAALLATRTDDELKKLLVPALANRITACHDSIFTWLPRWWKTGARFDSLDWARRCSWICRGSMTFREAYQRTGRILNVSCVPSDPHSPTILANYLTSPDCVIWSAVLASAAVPGILNPVVLMKKKRDGTLEPYSFGHKWKDGSLRTDIPLKALNLHFNVNFSIVSQVNPHINLFFFSSRGSVGRPVTHRRGRGWRGGFLGSATEQYLKLDLTKWLKVLRHLELLPRPMGQDWSEIWLQRFSGTITIWPKSVPSDFVYILSDPTPSRLGRMIRTGQMSAWSKLKFIGNRQKIERLVEAGRKATRPSWGANGGLAEILSEDDLRALVKDAKDARTFDGARETAYVQSPGQEYHSSDDGFFINEKKERHLQAPASPQRRKSSRNANKPLPQTPDSPSASISSRFSGWWNRSRMTLDERPQSMYELRPKAKSAAAATYGAYSPTQRRGSVLDEFERQSRVFFDDDDFDKEGSTATDSSAVETDTPSEDEEGGENGDGDVITELDKFEGDWGGGEDEKESTREEEAREKVEGATVVGASKSLSTSRPQVPLRSSSSSKVVPSSSSTAPLKGQGLKRPRLDGDGDRDGKRTSSSTSMKGILKKIGRKL